MQNQAEMLEYMTGLLSKPRDTGLLCPITGSRLMYVGHEPHVMDGESYYEAESDPKITYSSHPFNRGVYYHGDRYFVFENLQWVEYMRVKGINGIIPVDSPQEEIDELVRKEEAARELRSREYEGKLFAGEIVNLFPTMVKVQAKTIAMDLVQVEPMQAPSSFAFMMDYVKEKTSNYVLREED